MNLTLEQKVAIRSEMEKLLGTVRTNEDLFCNLADRWSCESEFEDIADYAKVLAPVLELAGYTIVKMTKRPFGCVLTSPVGKLQLKVLRKVTRITYIGG